MLLSLLGYGVLAPSATQFKKIEINITYSNGLLNKIKIMFFLIYPF